MSQNFIIIRGGIVDNNPCIPTFDLDVLDTNYVDADHVDEVIDLFDRLEASGQDGLEEYIQECRSFVREHGTADQKREVGLEPEPGREQEPSGADVLYARRTGTVIAAADAVRVCDLPRGELEHLEAVDAEELADWVAARGGRVEAL